MIRRISLAILCVSSTMVFAQPLYKWVEADGSITFSPTKPSTGISYETVKGPSESSQGKPDLVPESDSLASRIKSDALTKPTAKIEYAPAVLPNNSRITTSQTRGSVLGIPAPLTTAQARSQGVAASASSNKQRRCQDLLKRVVSLERRLKSRLTPEDMDNTVVHMARYQHSFDQHCVQ